MDTERERAIYERYAPRVFAYGLRHLRNHSGAKDLVQHVLVVVLKALREGRVHDVDHLDHYVFGTARNATLEMRRGDKRQQRIADENAGLSAETVEPPWAVADAPRLDGCLDGLEVRARSVVLATFVDDRDADEIGRSMGLTVGNVRVIRHRALAHLRECMEGGAER